MAPDPKFNVMLQREFGRRLRLARRSANRGQKELAAALRLSRASVSNIERGLQRIYLDQVFESARFLDTPVSELLPRLADVFAESEAQLSGHVTSTAARELALRVVEEFQSIPAPTKRVSTRRLHR